jgi:hypothetical protein
VVAQLLTGSRLNEVIREMVAETSQEETMKALLQSAFDASQRYYDTWVAKSGKKK